MVAEGFTRARASARKAMGRLRIFVRMARKGARTLVLPPCSGKPKAVTIHVKGRNE
jgi:hypothetical protein